MITIRKLKTLKSGTLRRKSAVLLQSFENDLIQNKSIDRLYLSKLLEIISSEFAGTAVPAAAEEVRSGDSAGSGLVYELNRLRHLILAELGTEPADWDLPRYHSPVIGGGDARKRLLELYLDDIRSPFNLGSIFRTAEAFGVAKILLSPDCPSPEHRRALRSSMGCTELVPWERMKKDALVGEAEKPGGRKIFALELGGSDIGSFGFPEDGIAVIGSEELGVSPAARAAAEKSLGLVSIPISGLKGSINVSVAFGIMMQRWSES